MLKNTTSQKIALFAFDTTTGIPKTGDAANITAYVNKDYGGVSALASGATEVDATNAKGWYVFDLAQAETNANALLFTGKSSTANITVVGQLIHTRPANFTGMSIDGSGRVDLAKVAGTAQTARDLGAQLDATVSSRLAASGYTAPDNSGVAAIKAKTDNLPASPAAVSDIPTAAQTAQVLLKYDMSTITGEAARSPLNALRFIRNGFQISGTTLTVLKEDDTTAAYTRTLSTDPSAAPVTGVA